MAQDHYIANYLKFEFFDSAGVITFSGLGASIILDNIEAATNVINKNNVESRIDRTQSGRAVSGVVQHPESWEIALRNRKALSFYKAEQLVFAFSQGYRCRFSILAGNYLYDVATTSFKHFNVEIDPAVAEFNQTEYRKLGKGLGLQWDDAFTFTMHRGISLTVPANSDVQSNELETLANIIQGQNVNALRAS